MRQFLPVFQRSIPYFFSIPTPPAISGALL